MLNYLKNFTARFRHPFARTGERRSLNPLLMSALAARERKNALPWLSPQRAAELYEQYRAGNFAEIQFVWDQLEDYDETLFTVHAKRQRALAAMPWQVSIDAKAVGKDPQKQQLAEAQQAHLTRLLLAVENLEEAIVHLGTADFRHVAALEITGNDRRQRWEVIEPWNLARPARRGPWLYNAEADPAYTTLEALDPRACIIREARPIDLPAMFLIVDKMHAIKGWDTFLDVFGSPSIFMELPPGTSEEMAAAFDERVQRIVSDGRGTIPSGSKFQTVETTADNSASFEARARWCKEAIITIGLGGLLTVEAESGSGTLAGNAHADSFTELCTGTAASIANAVNLQWARPRLQQAFPGQRIYAYFSLEPEPVDDRKAQAELIAGLAAAGYRTGAEQVQELTGLEVTDTPPPAPAAAMGGPVSNRAAAAAAEEDAPLTPQELAAFAGLATPNPARMEQRRAEVEARLRAAADLPAEEGAAVENKKKDDRRCHDNTCSKHGDGQTKPALSSTQDWVPVIAPPAITADEGKARLLKGETATDPRGETVTLDETLLKHWYATDEESKRKGKEPQSEEEIKDRCAKLPLMKKVIEEPHEIRRNDNGSITYLGKFLDKYKPHGEGFMVAFTKEGNDALLETYKSSDHLSSGRRNGELLWERPEKRSPDTSGT